MKHLFNRFCTSSPNQYGIYFSECQTDCISESEANKLSVLKEQKIQDIDRELEAIDTELTRKNIVSNPAKKYERIKRKEAKRKAKGKMPTLSSGQDDFIRRREEMELKKADLLKKRCLIEEAVDVNQLSKIEEKESVRSYFGKGTERFGVECETSYSTDALSQEIGTTNVVVRKKKKTPTLTKSYESKEHCSNNSYDRFLLAKYIRLNPELVCAADTRKQKELYGGATATLENGFRKLSAKEDMLVPTARYRAKMNSLLLALKKGTLESDAISYEGKKDSLEATASFEFEPKNMYAYTEDGERESRIDKVVVEIHRNADGTSEMNITKEFGADSMPFDTDFRSHEEIVKDSLQTEDCKKIEGGASYEFKSALGDGVSDISEAKTSFTHSQEKLDEVIGYFVDNLATKESAVCDCEAF